MDSHSSDSDESRLHPPRPPLRTQQQVVTLVLIGLVLLSAVWALRVPDPKQTPHVAAPAVAVSPEKVPLVTGEESVIDIFTRAGCPVCHTIPGIPGANGQVGPRLVLGATGEQRLGDPAYRGQAKTVHDYIVESVLEPGQFVVPGYPDRTMPTWYGSKLSALALEKIASYLEQQTEGGPVR